MSEEKKEKDPFVINKPFARDLYQEAKSRGLSKARLEQAAEQARLLAEAKVAYDKQMADKDARRHASRMKMSGRVVDPQEKNKE